ncbi:hypothetical protein ACYPKM_03785 [Pseudomonas aeruginosa]
MTNYVPFNAARKNLVKGYKAFLTNPENLKRPMNSYGNRRKMLQLSDYAVYAAIRGADYRKTNWNVGGKVAFAHLEAELASIKTKLKSLDEGRIEKLTTRVPMDREMAVELQSILEGVVAAGL